MQYTAVAVVEEDQPIALIDERVGQELDAALVQFRESIFEIVDAHREVTNTGILHLLGRSIALRRNDLQHRSIGGANKIVAVVGVVDPKIELAYVPLGKLCRIGRRDGSVFQAQEHKTGL